MSERALKFVVGVLHFLLCGQAFAQPEFGDVTNWDDGSAMDCSFNFEQEAMYEWDQIEPPPITIETAATVARIYGQEKGLTNVTATSFRLIGVRPWGHEYGMLVMFVRYLGFPQGDFRPVYMEDQNWLAITPTGAVVEPSCEDAP